MEAALLQWRVERTTLRPANTLRQRKPPNAEQRSDLIELLNACYDTTGGDEPHSVHCSRFDSTLSDRVPPSGVTGATKLRVEAFTVYHHRARSR
jgi:hypothetical protein